MLLLAHWDHFGRCAAAPAEDQICNGAVDNASGVAVLTEVARRLVKGPQPDRDIYFLATTAEEIGFLGAEAFAEDPPPEPESDRPVDSSASDGFRRPEESAPTGQSR